MTTWRATSEGELHEIDGVIHDAWFEIDAVVHDVTTQRLIIPFAQEGGWSPLPEDPAWQDAPQAELVRTTWRYREERVPFMRGTLVVGAVESVEIDPRAGDAGQLTAIWFEPATLSVVVHAVSGVLRAQVARLDVTAQLVNEIARFVLRRHGRLGWMSNRPL